MNVDLQKCGVYGFGSLPGLFSPGLKSTQQKQQRQAQRDSQVAFFENQKANLKNMECGSLEEISRKLDMFHSYEDQIAAVKEQYNHSQMQHILDEAKEQGERIAKAAEKNAPKTPEERREEFVEEALETDGTKGELSELMEELAPKETADTLEELVEERIEAESDKEEQIQKMLQTGQAQEAVSVWKKEEIFGENPYHGLDLYV